ncbi:asparagine synthetase B (glutamine-hydrolyzing) [Gracilibacillus halotolerans]|uniref:asparagine synthase (glutamine-hydrolyzing) n=1 Tax=Gracilibacillus halotolerans TaxID=74386 RepID=A0A841RQD5_9BACI|nr:asparagine synthase-related protein [Gracilibacillus halotolerans]MBB6513586.1 asparagine synthetase B (glutamine-hydrolyzing) [Gracilibacillus halotolerans]
MQSYLAIGLKNNVNTEIFEKTFLDILNTTSPVTSSKLKINKWTSSNDKIILFQWTNEPNSNIQNIEDKAFTYSGYTNVDDNELANKLFFNNYQEHSHIIQSLSGQFSIMYADGKENIIQCFNTLTRTEPLYYSENNEYIVFGNKAIVVQMMSTMKNLPDYNLFSFASFLNSGYFNDENTPFNNVNVAKPGTSIIFKDGQVSIKELTSNINKLNENELNDSYYDQLASIFIDSFKPLKKHSVKLNSGLTGGKDSRLIVAALSYLGEDFKTHTTGFEEHPDVVLAKEIANVMGIEHEVNRPVIKNESQNVLVHDILNRTINTLLVTDGMLSAYENVPLGRSFNSSIVALGGNGGEHLRGGFNKNVNRHDINGLNQLLFQVLRPFSSFINDEVQSVYDEHLDIWLKKGNDEAPKDLMMRYYIYYRTGKWSSVARSGYTNNNYLYQPFFDSRLIKEVLKIPAENLINDRVIYEILIRLAPQLVDIPFFADRWNFEKKGPIDGDIDKWKKREPLITNMQSKGGFNWRRTTLKDLKDAMYEEIFSTHNQKILNIINQSEVKNLFETGISSNREIDMFMWNLYTASILTSNDWLKNRERTREVEIRLPPTHLLENRELNPSDLGLKNTDQSGTISTEDGAIKYNFINEGSKVNKYIYTFEGNFTTPTNLNKYEKAVVPKESRLTTLNFDAKANTPQTLLVFFMGYDNKSRVFNESRRVNLGTDLKTYSLSYEHQDNLESYKIAIKTVDKKDASSNVWDINNLGVKFYK